MVIMMSLLVILHTLLFSKKQEVLGRTNRLLSFDTIRAAQKTTPPTILPCRGNTFTELLPRNGKGDTKTDPQTHAFNNFSIVACIRHRRNVFTEVVA
jgi:hypothetical protein